MNCDGFCKTLYKLYGKSPFGPAEVGNDATEGNSTETLIPIPVESADAQEAPSNIERKEVSQKRDTKDHCLILDLSAVNYIDTNGIKTLLQLITDYRKSNVNVFLCNPQGNEH